MKKRVKVPVAFKGIVSIPMIEIIKYQNHEIGGSFIITLKVPSEEFRFVDDHRHYTRSNVNACYSAPRNVGKPRDWYETQLNVSTKVRNQNGYPYKGIPFFVATDDGFGFLAHTCSDNNKQFSAIGDELILGRWLKGRLVEEGLIKPVADTSKDTNRDGMITKEMLNQYGANSIAFQKTDMRIKDPGNEPNSYEVWTLKLIWISGQTDG